MPVLMRYLNKFRLLIFQRHLFWKVSIDWRPYLDEMTATNRFDLFECYHDNYDFDGSIILSPNDLTASGEFYFDNALFASDYFVFQSADFTSDSSLFILFEKEEGDKVLVGRHLFSTFIY